MLPFYLFIELIDGVFIIGKGYNLTSSPTLAFNVFLFYITIYLTI